MNNSEKGLARSFCIHVTLSKLVSMFFLLLPGFVERCFVANVNRVNFRGCFTQQNDSQNFLILEIRCRQNSGHCDPNRTSRGGGVLRFLTRRQFRPGQELRWNRSLLSVLRSRRGRELRSSCSCEEALSISDADTVRDSLS